MKELFLPVGVLVGGFVLVRIAGRVESLALGVLLASAPLLVGLLAAFMSKRIVAWQAADLSWPASSRRNLRVMTVAFGLLLALRAGVVLFNRLE